MERNAPAEGGDIPAGDLDVSTGPMRAEDIDQITVLEQESFSNPWARHVFEAALISPLVYTLVQRRGVEVVGYLIAFRQGPAIEIANIAVAPPYRRRGLGRRLLTEALRVAREDGRRAAGLCVRESGEGAIRLYEAVGFQKVGISPGYYRSPPEDAILMRKDLDKGASL
jgi:ribosomal-protein-alanine N-acetyltransferase